MSFDLKQTDALLSTARAVRRRLDLDRDVPDDLLLNCIDLAARAPSGGHIASRRRMVIRDYMVKNRDKVPFDKFVSHRFPLADINEAFPQAEWNQRQTAVSRGMLVQ